MSEVSNKRFVHFDGTKEEFATTEYPVTYSDSIVFINGGGNDSSNCIYTHGEVYADSERVNRLDSSLTIGLYKSGVKSAALYMTGSDINVASGHGSIAVGTGVVSSGSRSFAQGYKTSAGSDASVKQPTNVTTSGFAAFVSGQGSAAKGNTSHAEGLATLASGNFSHSEGYQTIASGQGSHAEGAIYNNINTSAIGQASHAEGAGTTAKQDGTHSEGVTTISGRTQDEYISFCTTYGLDYTNEMVGLKLMGYGAHSEGMNTQALGTGSHAEGSTTQALVNSSHAEGDTTISAGEASHAEGYDTKAMGNQSHAEGQSTFASGNSSHAEGISTQALGTGSHAQGKGTTSNGKYSFAGGENTYTEGNKSFVFGHGNVIASGENSDISDYKDILSSDNYYTPGLCSMAVGQGNFVKGNSATAIGWKNRAYGKWSMAVGNNTITDNDYQFACGTWNTNYGYDSSVLFCVGDGTNDTGRNVLTVTERDVYVDGYCNVDRFDGDNGYDVNYLTGHITINGHTTVIIGAGDNTNSNRSILKVKYKGPNVIKLLTIYIPFNTYIKDYVNHDIYCDKLKWFGSSHYKYLRQIMGKNKKDGDVYLPKETIGILKLDCVVVKDDIYLDEYSIIETPNTPLAVANNSVIITAKSYCEFDSDGLPSLWNAMSISSNYDYPSDYIIKSMYIKKNGVYKEGLTEYWNRTLGEINGLADIYNSFEGTMEDTTIYFDTSGTYKLSTSDNLFNHTIRGNIVPFVPSSVTIKISYSETSSGGKLRFRRDDTTTFDTFSNYYHHSSSGIYDRSYGICIYADGFNEGESVPICYFNLLNYNETIVCTLINTDKVQKPLSGMRATCVDYCIKSDGTICVPHIQLTFDSYVYE